jgi:hypothetical protein
LESFVGGPQECFSFSCKRCKKVKSLEGAPKVDHWFAAVYCKQFDQDEIKRVTGAKRVK